MGGGDEHALERRLGGVDLSNEDDDDEGPSGLYDLGDDALVCILSFLSPQDVALCSCVSQRLRALCQDSDKVWYAMCERQYGSFTNIRDWWGSGRVSYKVIYSVLSRFNNLIGFWREVGSSHGSLVAIEWHSYKIVGYRVIPARPGSYEVRKLPFVQIGWIGVSQKEMPICLLDPDWAQLGIHDSNTERINNSFPSSQPLQIPVSPAARNAATSTSPARNAVTSTSPVSPASTSQGRVKSPFEALGPEWTPEEEATPAGLVVVDLHFVGTEHVVFEEYQQAVFTGCKKTLVEAAALASFGSSESLGGSPERRHSLSPAAASSEAGKSPPGSFPYEMYHYLVKKVTSPGGERAARKQRRRDRERALNQGKRRYESEHFVKIPHFCATREQPLQGLWKGISHSAGLDFVVLSYDDNGGILCRKVGDSSGTIRSRSRSGGSVCWTARAGHGMTSPLPDTEQELFELRRQHIPPSVDYDEEVVEMLWATAEEEEEEDLGLNHNKSRVWQYASGRFGFSSGAPFGRVVDFRPICFEDAVADVME